MKESHVIEFKESWRDEYLKWICGFANTEGGTLVLGRNDQGQAVGVKDAAKLLRDLPNKIRDVLGVMADVRLKKCSGKELIEKLKLIENDYLTRAAVLLFHPEPDRFFFGAFMKIGYFRTESDLVYHDEIHGDLFTQVQSGLELLLTKYLKAAISYRGIQRIESFPVPREALREALLNAVIHRDYNVSAPIQIRVYAERLRVWNPGVLPESWTVRKLFAPHSSIPYNPLIANAFFRAGEIEAWGRGMQRMVDACEEAGTPRPVISYDPGDLWMEFPFSTEYLQNVRDTRSGISPNTGQESSGKSSGKIVALIRKHSHITIPEMASSLGLGTRAVEKQLKQLKIEGIVQRIGPAKGGHWEVNDA